MKCSRWITSLQSGYPCQKYIIAHILILKQMLQIVYLVMKNKKNKVYNNSALYYIYCCHYVRPIYFNT